MNTIAFIPEIINKDWISVYLKLGMVAFAWFAVLIGILWDLYYGIEKAKSIGEARTSEGYRRTVKKVCYYWAMLTFALLFDALIPITYFLPFPFNLMPVITIVAAAGLVLTEWKSVRESADDKLRRKTDSAVKDVAMLLLSNKEAFEKNFSEIIDNNLESEIKEFRDYQSKKSKKKSYEDLIINEDEDNISH